MASRLVTLGRQAGFRGLFAGLGPRMIMTAGLVSGQFLIYGAIKDGMLYCMCVLLVGALTVFVSLALGARPGVEIHKEENA
jgi:solute carrier family 25 phosphate transporter 3